MLKVTKTDYGYFVCDKNEYKKIKRLYGYYLKSVQQAANWNRWHAKKPNNRIVQIKDKIDGKTVVKFILYKQEPVLIPVFNKKEIITSYYRNGCYVPEGFLEEKVSVCDMGIIALYNAAKTPKKALKNLPNITYTIQEINAMLVEITKV